MNRKSPTLGQEPPSTATVIFDGAGPVVEADTLEAPRITADGLLMEGVTTKNSYGDGLWHIEFCLPYQPKDRGQGRGNSGAYIQGCYEVQMLDSFGLEGKNNECGGVYSVAPFRRTVEDALDERGVVGAAAFGHIAVEFGAGLAGDDDAGFRGGRGV